MELVIDVTWGDIRSADRWAGGCPIAKAFLRAGYKTVIVTKYKAWFDGGIAYVDLPRSAMEFVRRFDAYKSVRPFLLTIEMPVSTAYGKAVTL